MDDFHSFLGLLEGVKNILTNFTINHLIDRISALLRYDELTYDMLELSNFLEELSELSDGARLLH